MDQRYKLSRRHILIGGGAAAIGIWTGRALGRQQDVDYEIRQVTGKAEINTGKVMLDLPRHSDAGTSVPMTVSIDSPMTQADYPKSVHIFGTENPRPKIMTALFTPACGKAEVSTRIRLDGAQFVTAVAELSDGSFWRTDFEIGVTFGACATAGPGSALPADFVPQTRISVPETAKVDEIIPIRALISHPMETGLKLNSFNQYLPLRIIERFTCRFNGEEVIRIRPEPAISTNPYFSFFMRARDFGQFEFEWLDTTGAVYTETALLTVQ